MSQSPLILVADDDPHIRQVVCFALKKGGYGTVEAQDGQEALKAFAAHHPALIVLDIGMPEVDGTDVCRQIRATSRTPIIFLSSRDDEIDRVLGLELGGDDYITKPFSPRELVARVKAVLRRVAPPVANTPSPETKASQTLSHGLLKLDLDRFLVTWDGQEISLTATEFGMVKALMGFPGKVYSRDELMDAAYGHGTVVSDRTIDSHLRRVRRKFAEVDGDPVETVHGVGYRLGACLG